MKATSPAGARTRRVGGASGEDSEQRTDHEAADEQIERRRVPMPAVRMALAARSA